MDKQCYIGSISYELGEQKKISELPFFKNEKEMLQIFEARGLEFYTESPLMPYELAKVVVKNTLDGSGFSPELIDFIILVTDSFWDESHFTRSSLNHLMNELRLINAQPIGLFMAECTGSSVALQLATGLINAEKADNILIVCANKVKPGNDHERIIQPGISILSDGSAACLVSSKKSGDYQILSIEQKHSSALEELNPEENFEQFVKSSISGFGAVARKLFEKTTSSSKNFNWLLTNNYLKHIVLMIASEIGFDKNQCYFDNISRFAHAHTVDTLINLADFTVSSRAMFGEKLLLLSNSPTSWGAVALEKI